MSERLATADFLNQLKDAEMTVLMLDYDGTLAPFQIDRHKAYPYPGVLSLLEKIQQAGRTRIVVITGRPVQEVQNLLRPLSGIEIWGAHGLEHMTPDGISRQVMIDSDSAIILRRAEEWLQLKGMSSRMEVKPGGVAAHWRGLAEDEIQHLKKAALEGWSTLTKYPNIKLLHFEGGLELRVNRPDKGDAVTSILEELPPATPIAFLGDDITDEDAFRKLSQRGLPILVREEYRETAARAWLRPPLELIDFLGHWLSQTISQTSHSS